MWKPVTGKSRANYDNKCPRFRNNAVGVKFVPVAVYVKPMNHRVFLLRWRKNLTTMLFGFSGNVERPQCSNGFPVFTLVYQSSAITLSMIKPCLLSHVRILAVSCRWYWALLTLTPTVRASATSLLIALYKYSCTYACDWRTCINGRTTEWNDTRSAM